MIAVTAPWPAYCREVIDRAVSYQLRDASGVVLLTRTLPPPMRLDGDGSCFVWEIALGGPLPAFSQVCLSFPRLQQTLRCLTFPEPIMVKTNQRAHITLRLGLSDVDSNVGWVPQVEPHVPAVFQDALAV